MKKILIIVLALLTSCTRASGYREKDSTNRPNLHQLTPHPRILLNQERKKLIELWIGQDSLYAAMHKHIFKMANRYLEKDVLNPEKEGRRLLQSASDFSKRMLILGYAWQFSEEPAYYHKALKEVEIVCQLKDWNPEHFLDVAEMTFGLGIGYDWFYEALNDSQRSIIRKAILEKGLGPSFDSRYNEWLEKKTNWNQVCNAGLTVGALAIYESEKAIANDVLLRSLESNFKALEAYGPDGAYAEGLSYWSYGTHFQVILLSAMERAFQPTYSLNIPDVFLKTAEYRLHLIGSSGKGFNYSDGNDQTKVSPAVFWISDRKKDPSLLWNEKIFLKNPGTLSGRDLIFFMLWSNADQMKEVTRPIKLLWYGRGSNPVVTMRIDWEKSAFYAGVKGGSPKVNHGHMDVGSFVLDALGERWAIDSGSENYHLLESNGLNIWSYTQESDRWKVTRFQTRAHNTLTIDGQNQAVTGHADFEEVETSSEQHRATLNLTGLYPKLKTLRRRTELKKNQFVIRDEFSNNNQPSTIQWRLITDADIKIHSPSTVCLLKNGKTICLHAQSTEIMNLRESDLRPTYDFESSNNHLKVVEISMAVAPNKSGSLEVTFYEPPLIPEKSVSTKHDYK